MPQNATARRKQKKRRRRKLEAWRAKKAQQAPKSTPKKKSG